MNPKPTLRELIDACRPDQNDPRRADLAAELGSLAQASHGDATVSAALQKSTQFDRNVRSALDDVPLPPGLAERLLAGCNADQPTSSDENSPEQARAEIPARAAHPRWTRRRVLAALSIAASLLVVMLGGIGYRIVSGRTSPVSQESLAAKANQWFQQSGPAPEWSATKFPIQQYPFDHVVLVTPKKWRHLDSTTIAYDLTESGGQRALLFVQRTSRPHNVRNLPFTKLGSSGGLAVGAWQRKDFVYVLVVVDDGGKPLNRFFRRGVGVI